MRFLRNLPIKRKLTSLIMLTSGVAVLLACLAFVLYEQVTFRRAMAAELSVLTDMLDDNVAPGLTFNDSKSIETALNSLNAHEHILAAAVFDRSGKQVARYQRKDLAGAFPIPAPRETGTHFEKDRLDAFRKIMLDGENIGTIYVTSDLQELVMRLSRYGVIVSLVLLLASLVAFTLSANLQHVISGPISHLAMVANSVATDKNYSVRAVKHGEDELGRLIDGFNEMLTQIQARDGELQRAQDLLEKRVRERTGELVQEVAEHEQSARALHETNQRFVIVTRATTDVIWDWNLDNNSLWWNENFQSVFGYPAETIGTDLDSWTLRIHPDDKQRVIDSVHQVIDDGGRLWSNEYRFRRCDGSYAFVFDRGYVLHNEQGQAVRMIGAMQDITERKEAEEARHQSESQFRQVWNASADGMRLTDRNGTVLMVNDAYCRIVGKTKTELEGQSLSIVHHAAERERILGRHRKQFDFATAPTHMEKEITLWNGEKMWIDLSNSLLQHAGHPPLLLSIFRDISERKRAEAELEQTHQQLLETSRQAGMAEVATGVLHNVGNVLNSVNVSTTLVTEQLKKSKIANLAKAVALMNENATSLGDFMTHDPRGKQLPGYFTQLAGHLTDEQTNLLTETEQLRKNIEHIKDIVAMQQSYAKVSGVTETLKISDLIEDALRMNAGALVRHGVDVIQEIEDLPPVMLDKHKVLQVLVNLIRNAKYACDDSSRTDKQIKVRVAGGENRIRIEVIDNGIGIPAENLIRIFSHGFTTRKNGHGFGLHSGALAAKEMGGALTASSDGPGLGATFTLELPIRANTTELCQTN
jgi:PAS domain S-box-containing protein